MSNSGDLTILSLYVGNRWGNVSSLLMLGLSPVVLCHIFHNFVQWDWTTLIGMRTDANCHYYPVAWVRLLMHILMHRFRLQRASSCWALEAPVIPEISFWVNQTFLDILDSIQMFCSCQEDRSVVLWFSHSHVWTGSNNFQIRGMTWHFDSCWSRPFCYASEFDWVHS